jgi:hypothetical protein
MTHPAQPQPPTRRSPFDEIEADWHAECRRHRRSTIVARWAREEPALAGARRIADVIPATWPERVPVIEALVRLASGSDELAFKALLQLLLPGLICVAQKLGPSLGGTWAAGCEVLSLAAVYIRRLDTSAIRCSPAWYVVHSVEHDLKQEHRRDRVRRDRVPPAASISGVSQSGVFAPSAEEAALSGPVIKANLADAVHQGDVSDEAAQIVWLRAEGHSLTAAAKAVGVSISQAHRLHTRALAVLRRDLAEAC